MVDRKNKRITTVESESRRFTTFVYHLKKDGKSLVVCKCMFLSTLSISEKRIKNALSDSIVGICENHVKKVQPKTKQRFQVDIGGQANIEKDIPKAGTLL